jgi:hypothetical protein
MDTQAEARRRSKPYVLSHVKAPDLLLNNRIRDSPVTST